MTHQCDRVPRGASWKPKALDLARRKLERGEDIGVARGDVGDQRFPMAESLVGDDPGANATRCVASERRVQDRRGQLGTGHRARQMEELGRDLWWYFGSPAASAASTCASGPTCIGLPSKRGALTQE